MTFPLLAALALALPAFPAFASSPKDVIPAELVGIWESDGAVFTEEDALLEGAAIYLRADGRGMVIGGPPPIGFLFDTAYDEHHKRLRIRMQIEKGAPCDEDAIQHDPEGGILHGMGESLTRRVAGLPALWDAYIGSEPPACPVDRQ